MRHRITLILTYILILVINSSGQPTQMCRQWGEVIYPEPYYDGYVIVFTDNFSGNQLNTNFWDYNMPWGPFVSPTTKEGFDPGNVLVENGNLKIKTNYEGRYWQHYDQGALQSTWKDYTSGAIYSKRKFKLGYFEIDYRFSPVTYTWPAFWLYGACAQEIDIFEYWDDGKPGDIFSTRYDSHLKKWGICNAGDKCNNPARYPRDNKTFYSRWNKAAGLWEMNTLTYFHDNIAELVRDRYTIKYAGSNVANRHGYFPFEFHGMHVIISQGVKRIGMQNTANFLVKQITIKKGINCSDDKTICNSNKSSATYDGYITGGILSISSSSCPLTLARDEYLNLISSNHITIENGFDSGESFEFVATATNCPSINHFSKKDPIEVEKQIQLITKIEIFGIDGRKINEVQDLSIPQNKMQDYVIENSLLPSVGIYIIIGSNQSELILREKISIL